MANEFRHKDNAVSGHLQEHEWQGVLFHIFNSQAKGDVLYASSTTQLSRLGIGSTSQALIVTGGVPVWGAPTPAAHKDSHDPHDGSDKLDSAAPGTNVTPEQANAAGSSHSLSRSDHMHYIPSGAPSELAAVQSAAEGTGAAFARTDHAHQIQAAITDDHIVTIDDSPNDDEFVRFTASGIEGLTVAEAIAALLAAALPENVSIILDPVLSADGKWSGITEAGTAGATLTFGEVCYLKAADSEWYEAKADATATSGAVKIGICVGAGTDGNACTMLRYGKIRADAIFPTFTISAPVFISAATAGLLTSTAPTGTTNFVVRIVGHANTGDEIAFEPDNTYVELA